MEDLLQKICLQLVKHTIILENIILLADVLGVSTSERRNLTLEIRKGGVDYYDCLKTLIEGWISRGKNKTVEELAKILEEMKCLGVAEILRTEFSPDATISIRLVEFPPGIKQLKKVFFNVLNPVPTFVGRKEELQQLEAFLDDLRQRLLVVSGIGGQGKTQLCRQLIKKLKTHDSCPLVIWLAGESGQALTSSVINFVKKIGKAFDESTIKTLEDALDQALTLVEDEAKVLWVADNVDTEYKAIETITTILLTRTENSKIIITSRLRTLLTENAEYLTLQSLSPEAAKQLIRQGLKGSLEDGDMEMLCEEMGYHALALQLSIGFIRSRRISIAGGKEFGIKDFLLDFNKNKMVLLDKTEKLTSYEKTVLHHVRQFIALQEERSEKLAKEILIIFSLLRHDGVEIDFLQKLSSMVIDNECEDMTLNASEELKKALDFLHSFSLIDAASLENITVHPLIQETTRVLFPSEWVAAADSILWKVEIKSLSDINLSHILKLWEIGCREDFLLRKHTFLVKNIFARLYETSQIQALIPFTNTHRTNVFRVFGNAGIEMEVLFAELYNGRALMETGEYQKALVLLEALQERASRLLGENQPVTVSLEAVMKSVLLKLNRTEETVEFCQSVLPGLVSLYGETGLFTMWVKTKYALALSKCGRSIEALDHYEEILRWRTQNFGDIHPNTLLTRHNIAYAHLRSGDVAKGKSEFKAVLKLMRSSLGEKHPMTLNALAFVARAFFESGEYEEARAEYDEVIKFSSKVLGSTHPDTLCNRHNHAFCLLKLGKKKEAATELEDVLKFRIQKLGRQHISVEITRSLLYGIQSSLAGQMRQSSFNNDIS